MINENILRLLDNPGKIMYVLKEEGNLRFEELIRLFNPYEKIQKEIQDSKSQGNLQNKSLHFMSRGTLSKHLKFLKDPIRNYVTQVSELNITSNRTVLKYTLTPKGQGYINQILRDEKISVSPDLFGIVYHSITDFFQELGFEQQLYLPKIVKMIARIEMPKFFQLPQTQEMLYTLFYIYQNMLEFSIDEGRLLYFELDNFCEAYHVSPLQIQYHLEKILEADLGFYQLEWEDKLFFQRNDLIGTVLFNLIKNALELEIIRRSLNLEINPSFSEMAKEITKKMIQLNLIRPQLEDAMIILVESLIIIHAIKRGFNRVDIANYWKLFQELIKTKDGIDVTNKLFSNPKEIGPLSDLGVINEYERLKLIQRVLKKHYLKRD